MDSTRALLPASELTAASRLLVLVGVVVVVAGLYFGRPVLIPLALGVVFAFLLAPIAGLLERCHFGRVPSVLIVLIVSFALLVAVSWGVTVQLMEIVAHLPDYRANIHSKITALRTSPSGSLGKATATVNDLRKELSSASETAANAKIGNKTGREPIPVQVAAAPRNATEYLRDVAGPVTGILETAGIAVIFALFILVKREDLRNRLLRAAGSHQLHTMTQALDDASQRLGRYLLLQVAVNVGYGVVFGTGLHFIGVPHSLLWGVVACLLRFVPYIGTAIATAFPMAMAMAVFPGWSQVWMTFAVFFILELVVGNVLEPWLYGAHTGISSLAILVAAIFWGMLWGPVGLILSTPLTVCLILLGRYVPQLSLLEILLGDEPVLSPQAHFYQRLLARDDQEAREIADLYLKENPLGSLYDSVLIPALTLAEHDRHRDALDDSKAKFIHQSTREMIEELYEVHLKAADVANESSSVILETVPPLSGCKIVCIPARLEADEIVGTMAAQLLRRAGYAAHALPIAPMEVMFEAVEKAGAEVVCVSALPPFATGHARSLCKQLRQRCPEVKIVLGLWEFPGGVSKAQDKVGLNCADKIGTSLAQIVSWIGEMNPVE
jgi:predicted PurR-regulated permease PerM